MAYDRSNFDGVKDDLPGVRFFFNAWDLVTLAYFDDPSQKCIKKTSKVGIFLFCFPHCAMTGRTLTSTISTKTKIPTKTTTIE